MKKRFFTIGAIIFFAGLLTAQESEQPEEKKFGIRFTGFVKSDYWYDTRQVVAAREDLFLVYPTNISPDANGEDINANASFNYSAITTRLTGIISGPDAFGAKTTGVIEADFSGVTNADINGFRLRHAFAKLNWEKSELLVGQYWHPMFVVEVFPGVISLNTGAPFQPFIRNPQIGFKYFIDRYSLNFVFVSQRDNSSDGPVGNSPTYMKNSLIPNLHFQFQCNSPHHVWGVAADYKVLRPRLVTEANYKTSETLGSYAFMAYYKYTKNSFLWSAKAIYGQNLTEHLMMGGYAVRSVDSLMFETYTPTNHMNVWTFLGYGKTIKAGLFGGFSKNLGTSHSNTGQYYARGADIDYVYRIAPSVSFISNKFQISTELEYTAAAYGKPDNMGKVNDAVEVGNLRLLLTFFYYF